MTGARAGMPSIRPNAMNDRRRRLEALNKHEDLLREAARQSTSSSAARAQSLTVTVTPTRRHVSFTPTMSVYVLDLSEAVEAGRVSWLLVQGADLPGAPSEAIFYSLVEGRGELMMFGGIKGDSRNLQRGSGSGSAKLQQVLNSVHFLSFVGARIH